MKRKLVFDKRDIKFLPIGFQFLRHVDDSSREVFKPGFISVKAYKTGSYLPSGFYRPISKIFK